MHFLFQKKKKKHNTATRHICQNTSNIQNKICINITRETDLSQTRFPRW